MSDEEADDADIYDNLPNFFLDEAYKNLEDEKKELTIKVEELGKKLDEIKKENEKLAAKVKALGKNISCLYKTAVRELERKDQIIAELRRERDNLMFRRGMSQPSTPEPKRSSRKQLTPTKKVRNGNIRRPEPKVKTNASKPEDSRPVVKAVEVVELEPPKEKTPEKVIPAIETAEVKGLSSKSEGKPEENLRAESNSKEETTLENSISEKTPANVGNIQILSGSEDSFAQTPSFDKFTSQTTTEDCGFGRRRKVRRIIRSNPSSAASTPARSEVEANVPSGEQPPSAKRICAEADISSRMVSTSANKSSSCMEMNIRDNSNAMEEGTCEKVNEDATIAPGNSSSKDPSVPQNKSVVTNQEKSSEEVEKGKQVEQVGSEPRKEDKHHSHCVVFESCEVDLKVSTDDQSTNSGNTSIRSQSDCSSIPPTTHTSVEVKAKTTTYVEEYSVSSIEFDSSRCIGSGGSSTPKSDRLLYLEGDTSPGEKRGKRSRSWERERNHVESPNCNQGDGKGTQHSGRDSHRERDRRELYHSRDHRSSRISSSGGSDRLRRMDRDPRGDRNYRNRIRDRDDDRSRGSDSNRRRDDDRRDSGRHGRARSRERRNNDLFHRSSGRNVDSERGSGNPSRDRNRREINEEERNGGRGGSKADTNSKSDKSPKPNSLQNDDHLKSNCMPPTEWD